MGEGCGPDFKTIFRQGFLTLFRFVVEPRQGFENQLGQICLRHAFISIVPRVRFRTVETSEPATISRQFPDSDKMERQLQRRLVPCSPRYGRLDTEKYPATPKFKTYILPIFQREMCKLRMW